MHFFGNSSRHFVRINVGRRRSMKLEETGLSFVTARGNSYFYNDADGTVSVQTRVRENQNSTVTMGQPTRRSLASDTERWRETISHQLRIEGFRQLLLVVTEQCNLRCRYCAYSGNYVYNKTHQNSYMTWRTAEQAIRKFYAGYCSAKAWNPSLTPAISFYGGEPLLNFSLIRDVTGLVKRLLGSNVILNLTTNGTLLTQEMIDFFCKNEFALMFSLNGYRDENDRLRLFLDGQGTYDIVWHKLQYVRHKYPQYYATHCSLSVVYDDGTDMHRLHSFFQSRSDMLPNSLRLSPVSPRFTDWYSRYSAEDRTRFVESMQSLYRTYLTGLRASHSTSPFLQQLFGMGYRKILSRSQGNIAKRPLLPFTPTCFPGRKIAVYPDGSFHCCERINHHFPIGNAEIGLDSELIMRMINRYVEEVCPDCLHCPITRFCTVCFALLAGPGRFERDPADICSKEISSVKRRLSELWSLFEDGVPESAILADEIELSHRWFFES